MRFKPLSERAQMIILAPIVFPLAALAVPFVLPMAAIAWCLNKFASWKGARNSLAPRRQWFAWRPVKFDGFWEDVPTQWLWLERVEALWTRKEWQYRPLGFVSRFDEPSA